jgi:predicted DNA-binding transcriptional regulator AlpA
VTEQEVPIIHQFNPAANARKRYRPESRHLLTREEAADYIGVSVSALAHWACKGKGPRPRVIGRSSYYHVNDLDQWIDERPSRRGD